jgi:hypothetical protein
MLITEERLLDAAGRPRSPATLPGYHSGRPPRNKGLRYPADPPRVEEIVAVMRQAGNGVHGARIRGLIVVLWRAGLRISEALDLAEADLDPERGAVLVRRGKGGKRRESGMDDWGWEQLRPWVERRALMPVGPLFCVINGPTRGRPWSVGRERDASPPRRRRRCQAPVRTPPTPPRPCRRDGARGRSVERDPTPAGARRPWRDLGLPAGHRQHRGGQHRSCTPPAHDACERGTSDVTPGAGRSSRRPAATRHDDEARPLGR